MEPRNNNPEPVRAETRVDVVAALPPHAAAFEKMAEARAGLPPEAVKPFRFSVVVAVANAATAADLLRQDRDAFMAVFKVSAFDPESYADLPTRAAALWYAERRIKHTEEVLGDLDAVLAEVAPLHQKLRRAALYLWGEDAATKAQVSFGSGRKTPLAQAQEIVALHDVFAARIGQYEGLCNVTLADVERAEALAMQIMVTLRPGGVDYTSILKDDRDRAGALLAEGVTAVREAAEYVFRKDPARLARYPRLGTFADILKRKAAADAPAGQEEDEGDADGDGGAHDGESPTTPVANGDGTRPVGPVAPAG